MITFVKLATELKPSVTVIYLTRSPSHFYFFAVHKFLSDLFLLNSNSRIGNECSANKLLRTAKERTGNVIRILLEFIVEIIQIELLRASNWWGVVENSARNIHFAYWCKKNYAKLFRYWKSPEKCRRLCKRKKSSEEVWKWNELKYSY